MKSHFAEVIERKKQLGAFNSLWHRAVINGFYLGAMHEISTYRSVQIRSDPLVSVTRGGGDSAYERGGNARRKFGTNPLKETDLGVAQALFDPFLYFFHVQP